MHQRKKLVLLPGWSNDADRMWAHQIEQLSPYFDIETVVVSNQTTVNDMADEVLRRAPDQFILMGHSLGGLVAQHVALKAPQRVTHLILVSTFPGNAPDGQRTFFKDNMLAPLQNGTVDWAELNRACVAPTRVSDRQLLGALAACQRLPTEGLVNQTKVLISSEDISEKLSRLSMPALIVHGREDQMFTLEMQQLMQSRLTNSTLRIIEDCGHVPALEQPQVTSSVLRDWLMHS